MKSCIYISLLIFFFTTRVSNGYSSRLFVWNVGQGQWLTWVHDNRCLHFDMGGEFAPLKRIQKLCQFRKNSLYLTHADSDHIRYIWWSIKNLSDLCLIAKPQEALSFKKAQLIQKLNICPTQKLTQAEEIHFNFKIFKNANDLSRVFLLKGAEKAVLIPGDASAFSERLWAAKIKLLTIKQKVYGLVLGHHGSRTSTSELLIKNLPNLFLTISSARKKRYGHPHPIVRARLKNKGLPLTTTEAWGNLILELK